MEIEDYRSVARRLFAISAVSGGALGAVVTYAALADSQLTPPNKEQSGKPPCAKTGSRDADWFGAKIAGFHRAQSSGASSHQPHENWKDCLQLLVSGDFLSPVFVGLVSNDPFQIRLRGTRAEVLEHSWEERYARLVGQDSGLGLVFKGDGGSTLAKSMADLRRRVVDANANNDADAKNNWLPVLLLNGTSVTTGKRIVTSDVDTLTRDENGKVTGRLFLDAYDSHELMQQSEGQQLRGYTPSGVGCEGCDIRLSTAVTMSARFPLISPAGAIPNRDRKIIDSIVDGGYYENFGATTAMELVDALKKFDLKPSVILVDNEPTNSVLNCEEGAAGNLEYPKRTSVPWFPTFSAPANAVFGTRTARGTFAAAHLCDAVAPNFAHIRVKKDESSPDRPIPMSWWLSKRVQKYLDEQLENETNAAAFSKIVGWLRRQAH